MQDQSYFATKYPLLCTLKARSPYKRALLQQFFLVQSTYLQVPRYCTVVCWPLAQTSTGGHSLSGSFAGRSNPLFPRHSFQGLLLLTQFCLLRLPSVFFIRPSFRSLFPISPQHTNEELFIRILLLSPTNPPTISHTRSHTASFFLYSNFYSYVSLFFFVLVIASRIRS